MCCSYHSNKALLMMKKYRIGRVEEPWTNIEPPIRAAKPHSDSDLDEKKADTAVEKRSRRSVDLSSVSFSSTTCFANIVRVCYVGIMLILTQGRCYNRQEAQAYRWMYQYMQIPHTRPREAAAATIRGTHIDRVRQDSTPPAVCYRA
jgi:hypothetical protein